MKQSLFIFLFFLSSCSSMKIWSYKPKPAPKTEPESSIVLFHPDLKDSRSDSRPVERTFIGAKLDPLSDFAKAVSAETMHTGYFQDVSYTKNPSFYVMLPDSALFLDGRLKRAEVSSSEYYSTLSILGWPLWVAGIPYGQTINAVEITYRLRNGTFQILFEKTYKAEYTQLNGLYYHPVTATFEPAVQEIALELAEDLREYFSNPKEEQEPLNRSEVF